MSWRDDKSFEGLEPEGGGARGRGAEVRKGGGPGLTFTRNVPKFLQSFQDPVALDHEASLALKRPNPIPDDDDEEELDDVQKEAIAAYEAAEKEKNEPTEESASDAIAAKPKRKAPLSFSTTKKDKDDNAKPAKKKRKAVKDAKLLSFDFDD
ncbi:hypothetical protein SDRG_03203 [Saprolegnia diclina VS20]|uniref:DUF4604 domain-containing protein n=1 Tax=Saprolegnia diclina (strain VS20) TaxID=1156394 RepID=T0S3W6_SAPDV|nr:hypothetical protein SDRG_03203 [Saprolegnia diclina VS20]EQC39778.1 hypothetical protein SDRG_03203 [Saprolegnia diclina VS20]|eukprot:XP_008607050.1 hypothetical protein SDRG_03203 [Saprolegnia diclina VS20]